jgi:Skp family chaperone for outer membrane proteins
MALRERTVLHALVIVVVAFNVLLLLRESPTTAMAGLQEKATLGPAASITLEGDDGELVLTTTDKHLAWGDAPTHRAWSFAFCHLGKILPRLMQSEHVQDELEALNAELTELRDELDEELQSLSAELEQLDPEGPEAAQIREQGNAVIQQLRRLQQVGGGQLNQLSATHMQASYREVIEAVNVVADRLKIDIVYRYIPAEDDFLSSDMESTMTEIQLRGALRSPEAIDITAEVMEELAIEE